MSITKANLLDVVNLASWVVPGGASVKVGSKLFKVGSSILNFSKSWLGKTAIATGVLGGTFYGGTTLVGAGIDNFREGVGINSDTEKREAEEDLIKAKAYLLRASEKANPKVINAINDVSVVNDVGLKDIVTIGGLLLAGIASIYLIRK